MTEKKKTQEEKRFEAFDLITTFIHEQRDVSKLKQLSSGNWSNVYYDLRALSCRRDVVKAIAKQYSYWNPELQPDDYIVGLETSGAILSALIALQLGCRAAFVRKGTQEIAGLYTQGSALAPTIKGQRAYLVDDVMTTGKTLNYVRDAILAKGAYYHTSFVLLNRQKFNNPNYLQAHNYQVVKTTNE